MKNLECVICGRPIVRRKTKRRFCTVCLERKARMKMKRERLKISGRDDY